MKGGHTVKITANISCFHIHTKTSPHCQSLQTVQNLQSSAIFSESLINSIRKHQLNSRKGIKCSAEHFLKKTTPQQYSKRSLEVSNLVWGSLFDPGIFTSTEKKKKSIINTNLHQSLRAFFNVTVKFHKCCHNGQVTSAQSLNSPQPLFFTQQSQFFVSAQH